MSAAKKRKPTVTPTMTKPMNWNDLICDTRLGCEGTSDNRNSYHRDFDRVIFSKEFRLLQAKTQVVPFPTHDSIHTRLTHSLETASAGRSLGVWSAERLGLEKNYGIRADDIGAIVSAACLCHDIGNPPLGHSGEDAISQFFKDERGEQLIKEKLAEDHRYDFQHFEGNAIGFNLLTCSDPKKTQVTGGLGLTYSTLAAFVKYPNRRKKDYDETVDPVSVKKPGLLRCDVGTFRQIANRLGLHQMEQSDVWCRHPLAYLTEAADDICYAVIDLEDGYRNGCITYDEAEELLNAVIKQDADRTPLHEENVIDHDERIGYFRAKAINALINLCVDAFVAHESEIMLGSFQSSLIKSMPKAALNAYNALLSKERSEVYTHRNILLTEAAGFVVLPGLLDILVSAAFEPGKRSKKIADCFLTGLICQEAPTEEDKNYQTLLNIVKYIALMTDNYAVKLYRELTGVSLPNY